MNPLKEIKEHFAAKVPGMRPIGSLPVEYSAYTVRGSGYFGVAIRFNGTKDISETSANSKILTTELTVNGEVQKFLMLCCYDDSYRLSFAQLCEHFVEPGEEGANRKLLLRDPLSWWNRWTGLLGDKISHGQCYSYIAELFALHHLYSKDKTIVWSAAHSGSHDIESDSESFEVKSTILKSGANITIHSQHQLYSEKPLYLLFVRMEESKLGYSINDMKKFIIADGYDEDYLEMQLTNFGFEKGASIRDRKYKILETRKYLVDNTFPKITKESFIDGVFPKNIIKIEYIVDLEGLPYTDW